MERSFRFPLSLATLAIAVAAVAQLSDTPPVSMGLWQTETNSTVTGIENTPMAGMASALGRAHVTQSCLTPEKWKSDIQGFNAKQQHGCTMTNVHQDAQKVSFDEACSQGGAGSNSSHVNIFIDSAEHARGTVITKVTAPNLPQPITINMSMVSHYLGSACGDVKPGEGKMIK
ncbi:MAG: DUF3617 family protein [Terracidiphilus sp.]